MDQFDLSRSSSGRSLFDGRKKGRTFNSSGIIYLISMATLAGIRIADKTSPFDSGAAMLLAQNCTVSELVQLASGYEVEIRAGSPYVVARTTGAADAQIAFDLGMEAVQQGLDLLSVTGKGDFSTKNAFDQHFIWWRDSAGQFLRFVETSVLSFSLSATATVTDSNGTVVPPPTQPLPVYHDALRYYRLSQTTDDLFDSFRNIYLAFELLLEHIAPINAGEREGVWLKRALATANTTVSLAQAYSGTSGNVVADIYSDIYKGIRCRVFHAKSGQCLTPQRPSDRRTVAVGSEKLARLVILLAEHWLSIRRGGGGVTYTGFEMMTKPIANSSVVLVSDNDAPFDGAETLESSFSTAVAMTTRHAPELSSPGRTAILGAVTPEKLSCFSSIARFGVKHEHTLLLGATVDASLVCTGVDCLQAQLNMQMKNSKSPKRLFSA
jgi:hypothetical protein